MKLDRGEIDTCRLFVRPVSGSMFENIILFGEGRLRKGRFVSINYDRK